MAKNKNISVALCLGGVILLYIIGALAFSALLRANKATPRIGGIFYYGRAIAIQIISIAITAYCSIITYRYFAHGRCSFSLTILLAALLAAVLYLVTLFFASTAFEWLNEAAARGGRLVA